MSGDDTATVGKVAAADASIMNDDDTAPETKVAAATATASTFGSSDRPIISQLVKRGEWPAIQKWYEENPSELARIDPSNGSTVLHALCFSPSTPASLIEYAVDAWPQALTVQEKRFGATPLHILVWSSQRSVGKVEILLQRLEPKDTMIRNQVLGSTVLHSACGNNAELGVLQAIVHKHPPVLLAKTFDQNHTAVHALWHGHLNSIPGHMTVAQILRGKKAWEDNAHFQRFWAKVEFLAMEAFKLSAACPAKVARQGNVGCDTRPYMLHGLLDLRAPLNALKVAICFYPEWASVADAEGNYPLHHVVKRRPFRVKDVELIRDLIRAYPQAAGIKNRQGDAPIHMAIRDRMAWKEGLGDIVDADVDVLQKVDSKTGLFPFMLAASLGGRVAVNTTYQLLLAKPYLIKGAITK